MRALFLAMMLLTGCGDGFFPPFLESPTGEAAGDVDSDGDGWPVGLDCNDFDPLISPDADELCNNLVDDDCDELIDFNDEEDCAIGSLSPTGPTPSPLPASRSRGT